MIDIKLKLALVIICASAILVGCATPKPLGISLPAKSFNSIASRYMDRPTWVSLGAVGDNAYLDIRMDDYGTEQAVMYVYESTAPEIIKGIDKYLEWMAIALRDGDVLSKRIDVNAGTGFETTPCMEFHSGNRTNHYLAISVTCSSLASVPTMYFDADGAKELRKLVADFSEGKLLNSNDEKYQ